MRQPTIRPTSCAADTMVTAMSASSLPIEMAGVKKATIEDHPLYIVFAAVVCLGFLVGLPLYLYTTSSSDTPLWMYFAMVWFFPMLAAVPLWPVLLIIALIVMLGPIGIVLALAVLGMIFAKR